jgi:hypothetical protein
LTSSSSPMIVPPVPQRCKSATHKGRMRPQMPEVERGRCVVAQVAAACVPAVLAVVSAHLPLRFCRGLGPAADRSPPLAHPPPAPLHNSRLKLGFGAGAQHGWDGPPAGRSTVKWSTTESTAAVCAWPRWWRRAASYLPAAPAPPTALALLGSECKARPATGSQGPITQQNNRLVERTMWQDCCSN